MNNTNRKLGITIETHEIKFIRKNKNPAADLCLRCGVIVPCFTVDQVAVISQMTIQEVCQRLEAGAIHLTHSGRAAAIVCGRSLYEVSDMKLSL